MKKKITKIPTIPTRTLLNKTVVSEELLGEQKWSFSSKCPGKWIHIDCEDGNIWQWDARKQSLVHVEDLNLISSALIALANKIKLVKK